MGTPIVSIITITRNRANLIGRCIKSIQAQTFTNYEHIIVDGASTDNTAEVVDSFKDTRIRFFKTDEAHSSKDDCWKIAFSAIQGKYLTFLDDDDEYVPTKLEKQFNLIESLPDDYGMVYCWMTCYDTRTGNVIQEHKPKLKGDASLDVVEEAVVSGTPLFFLKKEAFFSSGGWVDPKVSGLRSDWAFGARFCQHYKVDYVPESLVNVYINHGSVRMSENEKYYKDFYERDIKFAQYFLTTYKDIFDKYPKKSRNHVKSLVGSYFKLGRVKEGMPYYFKLLKIEFSLKNLFRPIYGYYFYLRHGRNK